MLLCFFVILSFFFIFIREQTGVELMTRINTGEVLNETQL